ncbi:MAG: hypothetical protein M1825_002611 [Sarcosagium campestre]|nr:MAG: hypothetical protein M1825_002611 [Sarcosagium campestre]
MGSHQDRRETKRHSSVTSSSASVTVVSTQILPKRKRQLSSAPPGAKIRRQGRRLSRLELLPTELLELIFVFSSNINFPCASGALGLRLSSVATRQSISLIAFPPRIPNQSDSVISGPNRDDYVKEDTHMLRERLLQYRWFTLDIWKKIKLSWEQAYNAVGKSILCPRCHREHSMVELYDRIPARLVSPPFSDDGLDLLKELILSGMYVDWMATTTGELAMEALYYAIKHQDERVAWLMTLAKSCLNVRTLGPSTSGAIHVRTDTALFTEIVLANHSNDNILEMVFFSSLIDWHRHKLPMINPTNKAVSRWFFETQRTDKARAWRFKEFLERHVRMVPYLDDEDVEPQCDNPFPAVSPNTDVVVRSGHQPGVQR